MDNLRNISTQNLDISYLCVVKYLWLQRSERVTENDPSESLDHRLEVRAGECCESASGSDQLHIK